MPTTVFALVKTSHHSEDWTEAFRRAISDIPEVVEAHRLTGSYDYLLKIAVPRVEQYDVVYRRLVRRIELFDVSAFISMETLKAGEAVPVNYAE